MTQFVPAHWLAGYPAGTQLRSFAAAADHGGTITADSLHRLLGDRRAEPRPDKPADPFSTIECLLKTLLQ